MPQFELENAKCHECDADDGACEDCDAQPTNSEPVAFPPAVDPLDSAARGDERFRETPAPAESLERIGDLLQEGMVILERIATALERIDKRATDLR
jgi:hypothetical protein